MSLVYLQKAIAESGLCSRRKAETLIFAGKVMVNGVAAKLGQKVEMDKDKIEINGKRLVAQSIVYYLLNKPRGYTATTSDRHAKKKIVDLVPKIPKVWPVGRLDKDSRGLIILTNDGELTDKLTHPRYGHEKEYEVEVDKDIDDNFLSKIRRGIRLEEGLARSDRTVKINSRKFLIVLHQGWKRQIRRMAAADGYKVVDLKRVRIGSVKLGDLKEGEYRKILNFKF